MSSVNTGGAVYVDDVIDFGKIFMKYKKMRDNFEAEYKLWEKYMMFRIFILFWMIWFWVEDVFGNKFTRQRDVIMYIGSGLICFILPFIEYIVSGYRLNEQYDKFNKCLWEYDVMTEQELADEMDEKFDVATLPTIHDSSTNMTMKYANYIQNRFDKKAGRSLLSRTVHGNRFDGSDNKHGLHQNWSNAYDYLKMTMFNIKDYYFALQYVNKYPLIATICGWRITVLNAFLLFIIIVSVKLVSYSILGYQ